MGGICTKPEAGTPTVGARGTVAVSAPVVHDLAGVADAAKEIEEGVPNPVEQAARVPSCGQVTKLGEADGFGAHHGVIPEPKVICNQNPAVRCALVGQGEATLLPAAQAGQGKATLLPDAQACHGEAALLPASPGVMEVSPKYDQALQQATEIRESLQTNKPLDVAVQKSPVGYLYFVGGSHGGSIIQQWCSELMTIEKQKEQQINLLATLIPASYKTVPKNKLSVKGSTTVLLEEVDRKWSTWSKSQRQDYYQAWVRFLKMCDEMEATFILHSFSSPPPPVEVFLLHTGPIDNKVVPVATESHIQVSTFSHITVVPLEGVYKSCFSLTSKKFCDLAKEAGGAYLQVTRRAPDAVLGQNDVVKWLAEDGIEVPKVGGVVAMDDVAAYERRSVNKGGDLAAVKT